MPVRRPSVTREASSDDRHRGVRGRGSALGGICAPLGRAHRPLPDGATESPPSEEARAGGRADRSGVRRAPEGTVQPMLVTATVLLAMTTCGFLAVGVIRRRRFTATPGAFRCTVRLLEGRHPGLRRRRPLRAARGRWAHGVLLLLGPSGRLRVIEVRSPKGWVRQRVRRRYRTGRRYRADRNLVTLLLRLDDGALVELSAPSTARSLIVGPFLAAAIDPSTLSSSPEQPGSPPTN